MQKRVSSRMMAATLLILAVTPAVLAWEHHPLITQPVVSTMPEVAYAIPTMARTLEDFLLAEEEGIAALLAQEEEWAKANLAWYAPCPVTLRFEADGNGDTIRERFFRAIRVNPTMKTPLYLCSLAGAKTAKRQIAPSDVSILEDTSNLSIFDFLGVEAGDLVHPADIVTTASNEPDYGLDVGLFEDNGTAFGLEYGFGIQPFGNPNLDFGSQAPFHMGFYHESKIVFFFASFLKQSYPEYRIHLFKSLSEYAFAHGEYYWGWRFMGWGLHYMADLSMPYHTTVLPGYSTIRMLIINLLNMLGWTTPQENALQLVSNRHMALEIFEGDLLAQATQDHNTLDTVMAALMQPREIPAYTDDIPRGRLAEASHGMSKQVDKEIAKYMPSEFVSDPDVELMGLEERYQLVEMIEADYGPGAVNTLNRMNASLLSSFAVYGRSYVLAILSE
ncbi:MAG TPA: hypothetical protein PLI09_05600 [Candidatus Hydrogenedentes bacterium]|nr:hypothetical protein [Candidatus Hydrogenedentota bacterium]